LVKKDFIYRRSKAGCMTTALQDVDPVKIRSLLVYNFALICIASNLVTLVLALDGIIRWSYAFIPGIILCFITCVRYIGYIVFETVWDKRASDFQKFNHRQTGVYICLILGGTGITLSMLGVNLDLEIRGLSESQGYLVVYGFIPMLASFVLAGKMIKFFNNILKECIMIFLYFWGQFIGLAFILSHTIIFSYVSVQVILWGLRMEGHLDNAWTTIFIPTLVFDVLIIIQAFVESNFFIWLHAVSGKFDASFYPKLLPLCCGETFWHYCTEEAYYHIKSDDRNRRELKHRFMDELVGRNTKEHFLK
jgi:hypothetical protein